MLGLNEYWFQNPKKDTDAKFGIDIVKWNQFKIEEFMKLNKETYDQYLEKDLKWYDDKDDLLIDEPDIGSSKYNNELEMNHWF